MGGNLSPTQLIFTEWSIKVEHESEISVVELEGAKGEAEMAAIGILLLLLASLFITGHAFLGNNPGGLYIY